MYAKVQKQIKYNNMSLAKAALDSKALLRIRMSEWTLILEKRRTYMNLGQVLRAASTPLNPSTDSK